VGEEKSRAKVKAPAFTFALLHPLFCSPFSTFPRRTICPWVPKDARKFAAKIIAVIEDALKKS